LHSWFILSVIFNKEKKLRKRKEKINGEKCERERKKSRANIYERRQAMRRTYFVGVN
jgi:hypothetical protein